ncbi:ABC transporter ATP-binding protein [Curvibacter sp. CHRR-16]|uniref:ABC transporter ATP-binding protein n=1 Tax=Curvibacter sp. CHRR-16 TaxID=2835872 RepID=UPI001BDA334A|nr:ABC transporter ATP-binding protein [Curvibacter sp. CHRR-16]MBT0569192.1 ABC transporter ATP-binding protein [Curvibacter sp. CHRR-16]
MKSHDHNAARITVDKLCFELAPNTTLLHPISFELEAGQRMAVVGPNGAGKSTLLKLLAGVLQPTAGQVSINGGDLHRLAPQERARHIAVMGQTDQADPRLRAQDYVHLGTLAHAGIQTPQHLRDVTHEALQTCGLHHLAQRKLGSLSGGERQRAHLARALAQQPLVLLLDEPTNHLDPQATLEVLHIAAQRQVTTIAVLHQLALAHHWAQHIAILHQGRLVDLAPPTQALSTERISQVFGVGSFYLPHPTTQTPMLVLDQRLPLQL